MPRRVTAALFLLLTGPLAAQPDPSDAAFVAWARDRIVPLDASGQAFRTLDGAIAGARLIGVGESVHETQTFLTFRFQWLQDLVRRHRVTALVLESGLPEAMAVDDYVRGRTASVDFDAALPAGFGSLAEIRRTRSPPDALQRAGEASQLRLAVKPPDLNALKRRPGLPESSRNSAARTHLSRPASTGGAERPVFRSW